MLALAQVLSLRQPARCAARLGACILHGRWLAEGKHRHGLDLLHWPWQEPWTAPNAQGPESSLAMSRMIRYKLQLQS